MNTSSIVEIVEILISDEIVVHNWIKLKDRLGLSKVGSFVGIEAQFKNGTMEVYELFRYIVTQWVSTQENGATIERLCKILNDLGFQSVKEKLLTAFANDPALQASKIFNNTDTPIFNFVGRNKELEQLNQFYSQPETSCVRIIGMGGVGKSEFVKAFACSKSKEANIIWLNGDSPDILRSSLDSLAKLVGVTTCENNIPKSPVEIFESINKSIQNRNSFRLILIIDNVDAANADIKPLARLALKTHGFVIVTSRDVRVLDVAGASLDLDVLDESEAGNLIRKSLNKEPEVIISELCHLLHNLPLALQQAVGFIKEQQATSHIGNSYSIRNYLNDYEKQKQKMLDFPLNSTEHDYQRPTSVTWNMTIDQIKTMGAIGDLAIDLLQMMAYFRADGIRIEMIMLMTEPSFNLKNQKTRQIQYALELLKQFSLIKINNSVISIHRLVQEVTRLNCSYQVTLLQTYAASAKQILDKLQQPDISHVISLWSYVSKHPTLLKENSDLPHRISIKLDSLSLYNEMERFTAENYIIFLNHFGRDHLETLKMADNSALAILRNGKYAEALQNYELLLPRSKTILGQEHEQTLRVGHNMALVFYYLDKYDEALDLFKIVLKSRQKIIGDSHEDTMTTRHQIASVLKYKREIEEALKIYAQVLEWQETHLGPDDLRSLITRHNIADCFYELKDYVQAKDMFESVLKARIKVIGEEHSSTLISKYMLAQTLCRLGEIETGLLMMREVLVSQEKVLGFEHPHSVSTRNYVIYWGKMNTEAESYIHTPSPQPLSPSRLWKNLVNFPIKLKRRLRL